MPIEPECVVCGIQLRVDRRRHTRYCRSTCRVRALRARRRGVEIAVLQSRYVALRAQAVECSLSGRDPIAAASLRPLARVMQRAQALASQLVEERQRTAEAHAQLVTTANVAQADLAAQKRALEALQDTAAALQSRAAAEQAQARAALTQVHAQLARVQQERDQARQVIDRLHDELMAEQARVRQAEKARDAARKARTTRPRTPKAPSAALQQARRTLAEWKRRTRDLAHELAKCKKRLGQLEAGSVRRTAVAERVIPPRASKFASGANDRRSAQPRPDPTEKQKLVRPSPPSALQRPAPHAGEVRSNADAPSDPAGDPLVWHKRIEIEASDELERSNRGTGRRRSAMDLEQRARAAARAARWSLLASPPPGYRQPVAWSVPEVRLDAASEKYLCEEAMQRTAELFLKLPAAARRKKR